MRYKIALGTAKGLLYLHEGCQRRIIHRDIKAANILLTEDFEPQVNLVLCCLMLEIEIDKSISMQYIKCFLGAKADEILPSLHSKITPEEEVWFWLFGVLTSVDFGADLRLWTCQVASGEMDPPHCVEIRRHIWVRSSCFELYLLLKPWLKCSV